MTDGGFEAPASTMEEVARWEAAGEHVTIDGVGHYPMVEAPDRFSTAVLGFLDR